VWVRTGLGLVLGLLFAIPAAASEVPLDWSVASRLQGPASIEETAPARPLPLLVEVQGPCPVRPAFTVDGAPQAATRRGACSFALPAVSVGSHRVELTAGDEHGASDIDARDLLVVSIGDSVASGEGNPDGPGPRWLEKRCHRSLQSGAALAAQAVELGDRHSAVSFVPLACSGATIDEGLLGPYDGVQKNAAKGPLPPQVDVLADLTRPVDALLISVGANDVNFGSFVRFCAFVKNCLNRRFDPDHPLSEARTGFATAQAVERHAVATLPGLYEELAKRLAGQVAPENVIVVEYFDPLRDAGGQLCKHPLLFVDAAEEQWAEQNLLAPLNAAVDAAAKRHGWQVVSGVADAFRNHGICARGQSWITTPSGSGLAELSLTGTLHPNPDGHRAEAALIAPVLAKTLGVAPGIEQIAPSHHGYVRWWWLLVVAGGTAALIAIFWLGSRWLGRRG
jgi:lysophospholipase L1-like esterase